MLPEFIFLWFVPSYAEALLVTKDACLMEGGSRYDILTQLPPIARDKPFKKFPLFLIISISPIFTLVIFCKFLMPLSKSRNSEVQGA